MTLKKETCKKHMVLCVSLGATLLTTSITYELLGDNERAVCREGRKKRRENYKGGKGDKKIVCPKAVMHPPFPMMLKWKRVKKVLQGQIHKYSKQDESNDEIKSHSAQQFHCLAFTERWTYAQRLLDAATLSLSTPSMGWFRIRVILHREGLDAVNTAPMHLLCDYRSLSAP